MIEKRKVISIGVSRYVLLPKEFEVKPGETLVLIHNKLLGFAANQITEMSDTAFHAELDAVSQMLTSARRVLAAEKMGKR